ncbi:MAG: hypothetical protein K2N63_13785, partial [Lachnospiraceae bacterium]|nr:hypothetical protein [Lachnospiraceae bacterium]
MENKMVFVYKYWDVFCRELREHGIEGVTAQTVAENKSQKPYLILKHDVETNVSKAYTLASIEKKYGHCGSYYVQAYLLNSKKNIKMLLKMSKMGHEISYHYDVMDSNMGNIGDAIKEFEKNKKTFERNGFRIVTVCQHGNPVIDRKGYTSNRDFFRSRQVQKLYPGILDIMVNFHISTESKFIYYSDAGRIFQKIYDPLNNDINESAGKNVCFDRLDDILNDIINNKKNSIISI